MWLSSHIEVTKAVNCKTPISSISVMVADLKILCTCVLSELPMGLRSWVRMQEEEDADYMQKFPDYHADFDDILDPQGDLMEEDSNAPQAQHKAISQQNTTVAQTSSASAKELTQGQLLDDIVALHARYIP